MFVLRSATPFGEFLDSKPEPRYHSRRRSFPGMLPLPKDREVPAAAAKATCSNLRVPFRLAFPPVFPVKVTQPGDTAGNVTLNGVLSCVSRKCLGFRYLPLA
jgi:hypothetical protein